MAFPDLELVPDVLKGPGEFLPSVAEATGVPVAGSNAIGLPFVGAGVDSELIDPTRMRISVELDPGRTAGTTNLPGVDDCTWVSLAPDKLSMTLSLTNSTGTGNCRITVELVHTIEGVGSNGTPLVVISGPGQGGGGGVAFAATLSPLFSTTQEIGAVLNNPQFNAAYSPSGTETSAGLQDDQGNPSQDIFGVANPVTYPYAEQQNALNAQVVFTLTASDGVNNDTDQVTATWSPQVYYGVDASPSLATEADIKGLANSALQSTKALSFLFTAATQYVYYAFPVAYAASPTDFQIGPFPGGMIQTVASVNVTAGTPGAPVFAYQIWRSTNALDTSVTGPQTLAVAA